MSTMSPQAAGGRRRASRVSAALLCTLALVAVSAPRALAQSAPPDVTVVTATLEQCATSGTQAERSATFTGEMNSIPGAAKMSMRIDVEERTPSEAEFHPVSAPGLGVWRAADPKVKVYKYLKQVTNLSSPASYRGLVRFRWLNARGHVIKRAERLTTRCLQSAPLVEPAPLPPSSGEPIQPSSGTTAPSA